MNDMLDILEDSVTRLLRARVTPELMKETEEGAWPAELWRLIEEHGLPLAMVGETGGGSALDWPDVYSLIFASGKHALPAPLPESLLAHRLLDITGIEIPNACLTIADSGDGPPVRATRSVGTWRLDGELKHVPWGRWAKFVVAEASVEGVPHIALAALEGLAIRQDANIAREPRDTLVLQQAPALAVVPLPASVPARSIRLYGALLRSAQIAGALEKLVEHCVRYANDRVQFGRPLAKFQAIQQQVAVLACESAAAACASAFAFRQASTEAAELAIASAKVRSSEAAGKGAAIAHAVHGAIGFTYEHTLHFSTRRLLSWRSEFGNHAWWSRRIGAAVCRNEAPFWPVLTTGRLPILEEERT